MSVGTKTQASSPPGCLIKTGTFTGDGNATKAITGVGFRPKYIVIYPQVDWANQGTYMKTDQDGLNARVSYDGMSSNTRYTADIIISLDVDGFTVGDTDNMNVLARVYTYVCFG